MCTFLAMCNAICLPQLLLACKQISSSCCDSLEQFVVDISPVKVSLKVTQF